jgi:hypothetical protein
MTEETSFNPCGKKGEVRARVATALIDAWKPGALDGLIARSADIHGPDASNGVPRLLVLDRLTRGKKASWLVNARVPHSLRYVPDAAMGLAGWFRPLVGESHEMLYQSDSPYLFDSGKFAREFGFAGTPYPDGIRATAASFRAGGQGDGTRK